MKMGREWLKNHRELEVYQMAFDAAMQIFELSKKFPVEEKYSLTDQIRRSSRSVCANLAEAWRKRRYEAAFVAKLSDSEAEVAETQTWIEFAVRCDYVDVETGRNLYRTYNSMIGMLVNMIHHSDQWIIPSAKERERSQEKSNQAKG
jgi:four helix bundle protein